MTIAQARRVEEWDKAAFVAYYSINANPFLTTTIDVQNPYKEPPPLVMVPLDEVEALK
ncbi:MAG: hypothetical protein ACOX6N_04615 [Patescibacteria group bacterium]